MEMILEDIKSEILYWNCSSNYHEGIGDHLDYLMKLYDSLKDND